VKQELRGPAGLVVATFDDDFSLNTNALAANIRHVMDGGMETGRGFIICPCGSGEYVSLSVDEHRRMVETAVEVAGGRLPVVAGAAGVNLEDVIERTENARAAGARYVMVPPPFYYEIDEDGMFEWYRIISESVDVGLMIYDQSWRADLGTTLTPAIIERLATLDNIVSLKYGSANLLKDMGTVIQAFSHRFAFIDNSLGFTATVSHMHGATGHISGPSTWWPEFELRFFELLEDGRYAEAERWQSRLAPYMAFHTGEFTKGPRYFHDSAIIKASLEYVGLHGGPLRPPFRAMSPSDKDELHAVMELIGAQRAVLATA